ncbi:MAG: Rpn family recombination-promoting nuclease/putative transposase [Archangium sp.]
MKDTHDTLFKRLIKEKGVADALLRHQLPYAIAKRIDGPAELLPESFIEASMKGLYADAVIKVPLKNAESAFVYCIVEHKRTEDRQVLLGLLRYLTAVYSYLAKTHPKRLPVVIPLIIYNGVEDWLSPMRFSALVDHRNTLRRHVIDFEVLFFDVVRTPIDAIPWHPPLRAGLLAMRTTALTGEAFEWGLRELLYQLNTEEDESTKQLFINYLVTNATEDTLPLLQSAIEAEETNEMLTIAESWERKGERVGEAKNARKMTRLLLTKRFGELSAAHLKKVEKASVKRLLEWNLRAVDAKTIDAVFAK